MVSCLCAAVCLCVENCTLRIAVCATDNAPLITATRVIFGGVRSCAESGKDVRVVSGRFVCAMS